MPNIYVRLPHYIASYVRNIDEQNPIPIDTPIRLDAGDPLIGIIAVCAEPNLHNVVNLDCFSERQWVCMRQGKMLTYQRGFTFDVNRRFNQPLSIHEIYRFAGRPDFVRLDKDGNPLADDEYPCEYVSFRLPSVIVRDGRERKVQSDWYLPNARPFIAELRTRFKFSLARFIALDRQLAQSAEVSRTKMESIDRFMLRYDIRYGDREREQLKKVLNRMSAATLYSFDADEDHARWSAQADTPIRDRRVQRQRPVLCLQTGTIYPSVSIAARELGIPHPSYITNAIRFGHRTADLSFEYADLPDPPKKKR